MADSSSRRAARYTLHSGHHSLTLKLRIRCSSPMLVEIGNSEKPSAFLPYRLTAASSSSQSSFVTNRLSLLFHFFGSFPLWISSKNGSSGFLASHAHQAGCCATRVANRAGLRTFEPTISDNGLLCQSEVGFQAELDIGSSRGKDLLH